MSVRWAIMLALTVLARDVRADDESGTSGDDEPGFNMLAVDTSLGTLPRGDIDARVTALGLSVEHPVRTNLRVVGGYEWLWVGGESGHRASLAIRRELFAHARYYSRGFIDGELGGSLALLSSGDAMTGMDMLPAGFVGLRFGYDLYSDVDRSPSSTFEAALTLRVLALAEGAGTTLGLAFAWGN